MSFSRRNFLTSAGALGTASLLGIGSSLSRFQAHAATTSGYKALVCLFLFGGLDNHDTVLPYDQTSYDRFSEIRASLMNLYNGMPGGSTRARDRLLLLEPDNGSDFGTRQFALPEEMSGIKNLFDDGNAAIVGNVGPLLAPLTRSEWQAETVPTPKRLFSHNDQQSTWMSSEPEGAKYGWGGRFAEASVNSGANTYNEFSTITSFGSGLFLTSENLKPFQMGLEGATEIEALVRFESLEIYDQLRAHFSAMNFNRSNLVERDIAAAMSNALENNELFNQSLEMVQPLTTEFPSDFLGQQLAAVARTISIRESLLMNRQVFFVGIGGFDTHSEQVSELPALQRQIDAGVVAFYNAMQELGLSEQVTLFTASDFGRTLAVNGDGTDHGWGGHHFVVGNAVQGNRIYGDIPPYDFEHDQDANGGRLIPSVSVEQFAEPLGRWFGLGDDEIAAALPGLTNFAAAPMTFI